MIYYMSIFHSIIDFEIVVRASAAHEGELFHLLGLSSL